MDDISRFNKDVKNRILELGQNEELKKLGKDWQKLSMLNDYVYNFSWLGCPIIQTPQDVLAMQEIIWNVKPDLIIETGIARGGSLIFYASLLEMVGNGEVLGIDIDIRSHNREAIEGHSMFKRITLLEGDSTSDEIRDQVARATEHKKNVLVCLDSNHTHEHVLRELNFYSGFVSKGSYLVVFDTFVELMDDSYSKERPWGKGNNPMTAVSEFLKGNRDFEVDYEIENKLIITAAPGGYLKKIG